MKREDRIAAVPVILVNVVAFGAQLGFWMAHLPLVQAALVSLACESMAVYWAWLAAKALLANDSAFRPRLASYVTALVIGALNYSHYMGPGWRPDVGAVTFGMMSVLSPWLWSGYARRVSRDELKTRGLVEDHAVRLGATRWFFHPVLSLQVQSRAAWAGENRPAEAIELLDWFWMKRTWLGDPEPDQGNAAPEQPPSAVRSPELLPETAAAGGTKAGKAELAAARNEWERDTATQLALKGAPLPGRNRLADSPEFAHLGSESTRRRVAGRVLADARTLVGSVNRRDTGPV